MHFAKITEETSQNLREVWKYLESELPNVLDLFYEHLGSEPTLSKILGSQVGRLKNVQFEHWGRLFSGRFDTIYMEGVYSIGMAHKRIGLEPRWYIAAYQFILNSMVNIVLHSFRHHKKRIPAIINAMNSAVFLDIDLVLTAYQDAMEREKVEQISIVTDKVVSDMSQDIEDVNSQVHIQNSGVAETSATTELIFQNLGGLNNLIREQAASVIQSSASVEQMIANIQAVTKTIDFMSDTFANLQIASNDGKTKISNVVETITHIAEQSEKLQEANRAIKSIASQTNLLAMNAAIEAAHAGDVGRGFAVVADEIRKLAEMSTIQSKEITSNIKTIRIFIQTGTTTSTVADKSFQSILDQISILAQYLGQIKIAMDEQSEGSRQILEATTQINGITSQVRTGSGEMMDGIQAISTEMQKLLNGSEQVRIKTMALIDKTKSISNSIALTAL